MPPEFVAQVEATPEVMQLIGHNNWDKMIFVSSGVSQNGLFAISEKRYIELSVQRALFQRIIASKLADEVRLLLQDFVMQYYFFTLNYLGANKANRIGLSTEDEAFIKRNGVEYTWVEQAGLNYYTHTFLKQLAREQPKTKWGSYYAKIEAQSGLDELPSGD
jgi:hypothetical protein